MPFEIGTPLIAAEKEYLAKLEHLLMNPPTPRLGFYTVGDASLGVFDRRAMAEICELQDKHDCEFGSACDRANAHLGHVSSACNIESTAG